MVLDRKKSPIDLATSLHDVDWEEVNVEKAQEWVKIPTCRQIVFFFSEQKRSSHFFNFNFLGGVFFFSFLGNTLWLPKLFVFAINKSLL